MEPRASRRQPADDVDGDILTFSELDFARLGLSNQEINDGTSQQRPRLSQNFQFPNQSNENLSTQSFFTDDLLNLDIPAAPQDQFWLDPALTHQSWQTSMPLQTDFGQDISSQTSSRERTGAPIVHTPPATAGLQGSFGISPIGGNHQPGLPRKRSRYFHAQPTTTASDPISIPRANIQADSRTLDPMQRWQESPPDTEAASLSAIADALEKTPLRSRSSAGSLNGQRVNSWVGSRAGSRAASTVSFGSATSCSSVSVGSPHSATRRKSSRGRVAKPKRVSAAKGKDHEKRRFPCTFCCDTFKSKYDWARHEKSLHLDLQGWRCTPFGGTIVSPDTRRSHCAYCSQLDPTPEHLETHNHEGCSNSEKPPTFSRKDHLVQHLRLVHHVKTLPIIDSWKVEGPPIKSRCGICSVRMETWGERVEHLAKHFRKGSTMDDWKGEHGFEPHVAARVTHGMPPYMIASEGRAPMPFSATSSGTKDHLRQMLERAGQSPDAPKESPPSLDAPAEEMQPQPQSQLTMAQGSTSMAFPEFLALSLRQFAQQQISLGVVPTDDMFRSEARRIVYDDVDPWDQTMADNDDWLSCFRNSHLGGSSNS